MKCAFCGEDELIPFECPFCYRQFCQRHRLPENHNCIAAPIRTPLGPWYAKKTPKREIKILEAEVEKEQENSGKRKFPIKKVIGLVSIPIVIIVFLWLTPLIIPEIQNFISQTSYTKVTVVMGQAATYDYGENRYVFAYRLLSFDPIDQFKVWSGSQSRTFPATEGAIYKDFGIEIKVSEVHLDHIVLLVKPSY